MQIHTNYWVYPTCVLFTIYNMGRTLLPRNVSPRKITNDMFFPYSKMWSSYLTLAAWILRWFVFQRNSQSDTPLDILANSFPNHWVSTWKWQISPSTTKQRFHRRRNRCRSQSTWQLQLHQGSGWQDFSTRAPWFSGTYDIHIIYNFGDTSYSIIYIYIDIFLDNSLT